MSQREEFQIKFVKSSDSANESETEGTSNLLLVDAKRGSETSKDSSTAASPESTNKSRLRLAVSEFSMKIAQRIEDKCNSEVSDMVATPPKPTDKIRKLALDVSKNVKTWSLEQQKLATTSGSETPNKPTEANSLSSDSRCRSSSCSEKPRPDNSFYDVAEDIVDHGIDALQFDERLVAEKSTNNANRLKSISFNENLSQLCSTRDSSSSHISRPEDKNNKSPLSVVSETLEGCESNLEPVKPLNSVEHTLPSGTAFPIKTEVKPRMISGSLYPTINRIWTCTYNHKLFPVISLTLFVVILRYIGFPDMLTGTCIGTYVTWYLFVNQCQLPGYVKPVMPKEAKKDAISFQKQTYTPGKPTCYSALMHLSHLYNPCTFRLRYSYTCHVSLIGTSLKIGVLDKKSLKDVRTKFNLESDSPSHEQLNELSLSYSENYSFDLSTCRVALTPSILAKKRYFNKKYPIVVSRNRDSTLDFMSRSAEAVSQEFYLFTLSMRSKEHWFTLLSSASHGISLRPFDLIPVRRAVLDVPRESSQKRTVVQLSKLRNSVSTGNIGLEAEYSDVELKPQPVSRTEEGIYHNQYITRREQLRWFYSQATVQINSPTSWFNAFAWRVFFEIMTIEDLKKQIEKKLQAKLNKIILPRILDNLKLSEFAMGSRMPCFKSAEPPSVDEKGLWLTFDVEYDGGMNGTIETRVNLLKVKSLNVSGDPNVSTSSSASPFPGDSISKTPDMHYLEILASESCESLTSSSESETEIETLPSTSTVTSPHKGDIIERVTSSRYFARLIAIERVGRAAEKVSLIPLTMRIEIQKIAGKFKINLPPPPSDRLWIGFEDDQNFGLEISLKPKVGNVELSGRAALQPIISYLERKIIAEFRAKLVLPSMDDFYFGFFRNSLLDSEFENTVPSVPTALDNS